MRGNASKRQKGVRGRASKWHSIAVLTANRRPVSFLLLTLGHACGMRVYGPLARGLWPPDGGRLCSLALRGQRPFGPRVADCRSAAMLIKSALRDLLSVSYGMKTILLTGSLRSPPPIRLRRTSPRESVSHDSQVASLPYSTAITDSQYFARHCVPSSTAVTDSLDFQVADAPLQIQFA